MDPSQLTMSKILGGMLFSGIGFVAFIYGKKMRAYKPLVIGIVMMAYPLVVTDDLQLYGIGILLSVALYYFRD